MPLEVIGAGFGRTGTLSLKLALERLGYAKCYHMAEVFGHLDAECDQQRVLLEHLAIDEDDPQVEIVQGPRQEVDHPSSTQADEAA